MKPSLKNSLKSAAAATALLMLAGCAGNQNAMNIYGPGTDANTQARVDRLMRYCEKLSKSGDYNLASGLCLRAHDIDPSNPLPLMLVADNFNKTGDFDKSAQAYSAVLENHPQLVEARYRLGKAQMDMGNTELAMETFMTALAEDPTDPRIHNALGVISDQRGQHEAAQFHYREALAADPTNLSIASNLGLSLALSGQRDEAIALLNKVVSDPNASEVSHHNLALAYASEAKPQEPHQAEADVESETFGVEPVELVPFDQSSDRPAGMPEAPLAARQSDSLRGRLVNSAQVAKAPPTSLVGGGSESGEGVWDVPETGPQWETGQAVDSSNGHVLWDHYTPGYGLQYTGH